MNCLETCFNYLKFTRTEYEVREYLKQSGFKDDEIEEAISKSKEYDYINDSEYAKDYIKDHILINKWGPIKIHYNLRQKGIYDDYNEYIDDNYHDSMIDNIKNIIENKYYNLDLNEYNNRGKVLRYFYQKGYNSEIVNEAIDG